MLPQEETPANSAADPCLLSPESADNISERLSNLDNLYFPRAKQSSAASPSQRKSLLLDLISCDVAVFLERYGSQLTLEELKQFDVLKEDYEINWHLNRLRSLLSPTKEDLKLKSVMIKNRRRAYLDKLVDEGHYFSEDAMREREPYLHHEYLGKFQDPSGRSMARPGERWFETLMRQAEEAMLVEKIRGEQQRRGVARSDWVGSDNQPEQMVEVETESEEEESEKEEVESEEEATENHVANGASHNEEVSQFMHMPRRSHLEAALRILKYLKKDPGLGILYKRGGNLTVEGFVDADWASSVVDRKSTSGWCMFIGGNLVSWRSKKQAVVARSSAEAEFRAVALGICELIWIRRVLTELRQPLAAPIRFYCDSKSAISIANNPVQHDRTKHVEIDKHFIKEKLDDGSMCLIYVPTKLQVADIFTKGLPKVQSQFCISKLGLLDLYKPA